MTPSKVFFSKTTQANLQRIYNDHVERQLFRGRDGILPEALRPDAIAVCRLISFKVRRGHYHFTQYVEQLKSKGAGKNPRVLSIPTARDRILLRALSDCLLAIYPNASGVIPQVRILGLSKELDKGRFDSFVKIDIRNFYPSIDHEVLRTALSQRIRTPALLGVVMDAIKTPTVPAQQGKRPASTQGVPQGLAISNVLSELVLAPVDLKLLSTDRHAYFRFVDDILILCNSGEINEIANDCLGTLAEQKLFGYSLDDISGKSKSGPLNAEFEYLGYRFAGTAVSVRWTSIHGLENRLASEFTKFRSRRGDPKVPAARILENKVNLAITGCVWDGTAYGWLSYFRQMNDLTLLKSLDRTVERFCYRFKVPDSVSFKTFMRAYWAIKHPDGKDGSYVPNFDNLTVVQMRDRLEDFMSLGDVAILHDRAVPRVFRKLMTKLTSELERDVGDLS